MKTERKRHTGLVILCVILVLLVLIAAAPFLYDAAAGFDDYDDPAALIAANAAPMDLTADSGWGVTVRLDKADIYTLAEQQGVMEQLTAQLSGLTDDRLKLEKYAYSLDGDRVELRVKVKLFGFLPIQLRAEADLTLTPGSVTLVPKGLYYGKWISLPMEKLASFAGAEALLEGFTYDFSDLAAPLGIDSIKAENDGLTLHSVLAKAAAEALAAAGPTDSARVLALMSETVPPEITAVCSGDLSVLSEGITDMDGLFDALTRLAAVSRAGTAAALLPLPEELFGQTVEPEAVQALQAEYSAMPEAALERYEQALNGLRDSYKQKEYTLTRDFLRSADGLSAESALPEDWGARIVLQYNREFESIVRANDGVFSAGLQKWLVLPNPSIYALKRDAWASLPNVPGVEVFDLTLALRLPDGTPALIFDTAEGQFAVNTIPETLYQELLSAERLPVLCASDVPRPERSEWIWLPSRTEARSDVYFMLGAENETK